MNGDQQVKPTLAECRAAARTVLRSECSRDVLGLLRPRGISPLLHAKPPLTLQLYAAAASGRLVWRHSGAFALIDEPSTALREFLPKRRSHAVRLSLRNWDVFVFGAPPAAALVIAFLCALAAWAGAPPVWLFVVAALLLCVAAVVWVAVHMIVVVPAAIISVLRALDNRQEPAEVRALDLYRQENWTLPLLHVDDPAEVPVVLEAARAQAAEYARPPRGGFADDRRRRRGTGQARNDGGDSWADAGTDDEPLLCIERGITTVATRSASR